MCGICGIVNLDGKPVPSSVLRSMTESIAHRGPDAEGLFVGSEQGAPGAPAVGMGHRRLAVIDLSPEAGQPMANAGETLRIVFNGEIYNFRELRADLEREGRTFRSNSDTEVILHLYEKFGESCVEHLDGMFAFAVWDHRRRQLFLARDRVGKKPLFYAATPASFLFASEVKAILRHPEIEPAIALDSLPEYFVFGYPTPGRTFYQNIFQVPPAHTLVLTASGRMELRRYWDVAFASVASSHPSLPDAIAEVRRLVTAAVQKRLVADVPLGAFLSGGVDSSIVVGIMSRLQGKPVKTFSLGFVGDTAFDETPYARQVAKHFGTDHTEFIVEPKAIDLIEAIVHRYDGPFGDSSAIPTSIVSGLTREHVTVALNGDGGDEVFAGYLRFKACLAAERLPAGLSRAAGFLIRAFPEPTGYYHPLRRAHRFFAAAPTPLFERLKRWIGIFDDDLQELLRPELFQAAFSEIGFPQDVLKKVGSYSTLSKLLFVNFTTYLPEDLLVKVDRATMAYGLEGRSPFLDRQLIEYVAGLPDQFKIRRGTSKFILKKAFADLVPDGIFQRSKRGFGVPLGAWFRKDLREYVQDILLTPRALSYQYVRPGYVARLVQDHVNDLKDNGARLWALLAFEIWLRSAKSRA